MLGQERCERLLSKALCVCSMELEQGSGLPRTISVCLACCLCTQVVSISLASCWKHKQKHCIVFLGKARSDPTEEEYLLWAVSWHRFP